MSFGVLPGECFLFLRQHSFLSHLSLSRILRILGWVLSQARESYSAFYGIKTSLLPKFSMAVATDWSILPNEGLQDDAVISQACHPSLHMTTWHFLSVVLRWPHQQETANLSGSSGPCLTSSNKENSVRKDFIEGFSLGEMAALFLPWVLTAGEYSCMPFGIQSSPLSFLLLKSFGGFWLWPPLVSALPLSFTACWRERLFLFNSTWKFLLSPSIFVDCSRVQFGAPCWETQRGRPWI